MSMPSQLTDWTIDMLESLPDDGNRYEIIDGELLVSPAPSMTHQRIVQRLGMLLTVFVTDQRLPAEVFFTAADIAKNKRNLVQPDVLVVDLARGADRSKWPPMSSLLLACEVVSPSTASRDRREKRRLYLGEGVEYWIVDPVGRVIERWRPNESRPEILVDTLVWEPVGAGRPLAIDIEQLFEPPPEV